MSFILPIDPDGYSPIERIVADDLAQRLSELNIEGISALLTPEVIRAIVESVHAATRVSNSNIQIRPSRGQHAITFGDF